MTVDAEPGGAAVLRAKHQRGVVRPDHGEVGAFGERLVEGTGGDRLSEPGDLVLVAEHRAIPGDGGDVVSLRAHLYRRGEDARFDHCGASLTGEPAGAGSSFGSSVGSGSGGGSGSGLFSCHWTECRGSSPPSIGSMSSSLRISF